MAVTDAGVASPAPWAAAGPAGYRARVSETSSALSRGAFPILVGAAVVGGGELAWASAELWRAGGGVGALLWAGAALAVAIPLGLLELSLVGDSGRSLPAALGPGWRGWVGWLALTIVALNLLARLGRLGGILGDPALGAALAAALPALGWALSARQSGATLGAVLVVGLLGVGALAALGLSFTGPDGPWASLAVLVPRASALPRGGTWAEVSGAALATAPAVGLIAGFAPRLGDRARPAGQLAIGGLVATILAMIGGVAAYGLRFGAAMPGAGLGAVGVDLLVPERAAWVLPLATVAGCLGLALGLGVALRGARPGGLAGGALFLGVGLAGAALSVGGPAGVLTGQLLSSWASGVGLPLLGLLLCLAARPKLDDLDLFRAADRGVVLRLQRWLPVYARRALPALLGLALLARLRAWALVPPGAAEADALGPLGPLTGALHIAVPALALVLAVAVSTGLHWTADPGQGGGR